MIAHTTYLLYVFKGGNKKKKLKKKLKLCSFVGLKNKFFLIILIENNYFLLNKLINGRRYKLIITFHLQNFDYHSVLNKKRKKKKNKI